MCGIAGFITFKGTLELKYLKAMNDKLEHRGPDDEGYYFIDENNRNIALNSQLINIHKSDLPNDRNNNFFEVGAKLAFGHRRLSIIDLSSLGHQPLNIDNGNYWITYNGEVYNFIEIREELEKLGYTFKSNTDTEVIIVSYKHWGVKCLNKFNGMFSFVIYNKLENKLFIARDRFGIKPLYYYKDENIFAFASEIKALFELPMIKPAPNYLYLKNYLDKGANYYSKDTSFLNIYRFNISSFWEGDFQSLQSQFEPSKFWNVTPNFSLEKCDPKMLKVHAEKYYNLLKDSVRLRLRADVTVGSALSGGLDSSSVVYLMHEELKEIQKTHMLETFSTVYFTEDAAYCDESKYINELAATLNVNSNQIEPNVNEVINEHKKAVYALEDPIDSTAMSIWNLFKLVHEKNISVTLDGQGADEQLAGYLQYIIYYLAQLPLFKAIPEFIKFSQIPGAIKFSLKGLAANLLSKVLTKRVTSIILKKIGVIRDVFKPVNQELWDDANSELINLLHYADHTSMAFSVESRMPFMDYRLVEYIASIPISYKLHNGWTKYVAREAFSAKLPDSICWRKDKMGWPIPEKNWFYVNLKTPIIDKIYHCNILKELLPHLNIKENYDKTPIHILIRFYNIAVWEEVFLQGLKF